MGVGAIPPGVPRTSGRPPDPLLGLASPSPRGSSPQSRERHPEAGSEGPGTCSVKGEGCCGTGATPGGLLWVAPRPGGLREGSRGGSGAYGEAAGAGQGGGARRGGELSKRHPGRRERELPYVSLSCEASPPPSPPPLRAGPARHEHRGAVLRLGAALQGVVCVSEGPGAGLQPQPPRLPLHGQAAADSLPQRLRGSRARQPARHFTLRGAPHHRGCRGLPPSSPSPPSPSSSSSPPGRAAFRRRGGHGGDRGAPSAGAFRLDEVHQIARLEGTVDR